MSDNDTVMLVQVGAVGAYLLYWHTRLQIVLKTIDVLHRCTHYVTQNMYIECMSGAMTGGSDLTIHWQDAAAYMEMIGRRVPSGTVGLWRTYREYKEAKELLAIIAEKYEWMEL